MILGLFTCKYLFNFFIDRSMQECKGNELQSFWVSSFFVIFLLRSKYQHCNYLIYFLAPISRRYCTNSVLQFKIRHPLHICISKLRRATLWVGKPASWFRLKFHFLFGLKGVAGVSLASIRFTLNYFSLRFSSPNFPFNIYSVTFTSYLPPGSNLCSSTYFRSSLQSNESSLAVEHLASCFECTTGRPTGRLDWPTPDVHVEILLSFITHHYYAE